MPDIDLGSHVVFDAYTSPGWFILALCVAIFFLVIFYFDPQPSPSYGDDNEGYRVAPDAGGKNAKQHAKYSMDKSMDDGSSYTPPNARGLTVLLILFVIHFFR